MPPGGDPQVPARPLRSSSGRPLVRIGALAIAALGLVTVVSRAVSIRADDLSADDFTQDYVSAHAWTHDDDVYGFQRSQVRRHVDANIYIDSLRPAHRNPHTPAQVLLVAPLSALPYRDARTIWLLISAGLTALAIFGVTRSMGMDRTSSAVLGVGALAIPVVVNDLLYGQLGGPLLALLVLAWRAHADGHQTRAGIALGVACALKLFPAFLLIPLLRKGMTRAAAVAVATAVGVGGAAMLIVGPAASWRWFSVVAPDNLRFWRASPANIALPGTPFRWLTESPWKAGGPDLPNLATVLAVALMIACVVAALTTRAGLSRDPFVAALPWMLLAGPLTGDLSLPILLPFVFLVARAIVDGAAGGAGTRILLGLALAVAVIGTPPWVPGQQPELSVATIVLGYGLPTIAMLTLAMRDGSAGRLSHAG